MLACIVSTGAVDVSSWVLLLLLLQLLLLGNSRKRRPTPKSVYKKQNETHLEAIKLIRSGEFDRYEKLGGRYHTAVIVCLTCRFSYCRNIEFAVGAHIY